MACEICGRSSCTRAFHSLAEQEEHDNQTAAAQVSSRTQTPDEGKRPAPAAAIDAAKGRE